MTEVPFTYTLTFPVLIPSHYDEHIQRRLSSLRGQFLDRDAFEDLIAIEDSLVYEVYEIRRPEKSGEILSGISIVHPGLVGREFFMTKGHFHRVVDTAEVYICLKGEGYMVMETLDGESCVESLVTGTVLYVSPKWAHRVVCTSRQEDLITFFACPSQAGHDYETIERQGFKRLVLEGDLGRIEIVDNPYWNKT